jgi:PleD family two-component response regulator
MFESQRYASLGLITDRYRSNPRAHTDGLWRVDDNLMRVGHTLTAALPNWVVPQRSDPNCTVILPARQHFAAKTVSVSRRLCGVYAPNRRVRVCSRADICHCDNELHIAAVDAQELLISERPMSMRTSRTVTAVHQRIDSRLQVMSGMHRPSRPPVVLIANDQDWASRSLESILAPRGYAVLRANTAQNALKLVRVTSPDAFILDGGISDGGGINLCAQLRRDSKLPLNAPIFITTTAASSRAERLAAYSAGAWELCSEPLDSEVLIRKLDTYVQAKLAADRTRDESLVDEETGLYNARGLARRAREMGSDAVRRRAALACVAFASETDLDPTVDGDRGIAELVRDVCRREARGSDVVGRLGPNEYAILAYAAGEEGAERLVARLREGLSGVALRSGGREQRLRFQAAIAAVSNLADVPTDAVDLLYNAAASLREARNSAAHPSQAFADRSNY